jgi:hypothetical protein
MPSLVSRFAALMSGITLICSLSGCSIGTDSSPAGEKSGNNSVAQMPPPGKGGGPGKEGKGRPKGEPSPIHDIMVKMAKGPQSLNAAIGEELKVNPPPWDKLQPQTREFVDLATALVKLEPRKGSKESWAKFTASFTDSTAALDRSAQAQDKDAAMSAHKALGGVCMGCHQQHKGGPGGFGPKKGGFGPKEGGPG